MASVASPERNPFIAGSWVRGDDFFGRGELLRELLEGERHSLWVLGGRRLGKTSLLKELEHRVQKSRETPFVPLYWDLQGSGDARGLAETLLASVEETTLEQWRAVKAVNSDGVFLGCKHAIPALLRGGGGSIVNLSSAAALVGTPAFAAYSASKGAVRSLSRTVAVHCAQRGYPIRCNSIHPGGIDTPMLQSLGTLAADAAPIALELLAKQPSGRVGRPEDVAELVLYLLSDASVLVTGAEWFVGAQVQQQRTGPRRLADHGRCGLGGVVAVGDHAAFTPHGDRDGDR